MASDNNIEVIRCCDQNLLMIGHGYFLPVRRESISKQYRVVIAHSLPYFASSIILCHAARSPSTAPLCLLSKIYSAVCYGDCRADLLTMSSQMKRNRFSSLILLCICIYMILLVIVQYRNDYNPQEYLRRTNTLYNCDQTPIYFMF